MKELSSQPKPINQLLDEGIKLFLVYFPKISSLILATVILTILMQLWMPALNATDHNAIDHSVVSEVIMANFWYFFLYAVVLLVLQTAIFYRIGCLMTATDQGDGEALWQGLKYLLPLLLASWIYFLLVGIGLLIIVPGIIFAVSFCFFTPLILFEKKSVMEAFSQSHRLVWKHWWRTAIVLGLSILISFMAGILLTIVVKNLLLVGTTLSQEEMTFWLQVTSAISEKLLTPFVYIMLLLQYEELKRYQQRSQHFQTDLLA
jgi:hypothetical protein